VNAYKHYIFDDAACIVYQDATHERGHWYVRQYHSRYAMKAHFKHLTKGAAPPRHWGKPKGWDWGASYSEDGPFTKKDALQEALSLCEAMN
jgi:hypothetical protein